VDDFSPSINGLSIGFLSINMGEFGSDCAIDGAEDPEPQCATLSGTTTSTATGEDVVEEDLTADIRDSSSAFVRSSSSCFRSLAAASDRRIAISRSLSSSEGGVLTNGGFSGGHRLLAGLLKDPGIDCE